MPTLTLCAILLIFTVCHGAKEKPSPLPMVSPPITRKSRSLAPIPFKGAFKGTSRTAGMMYTYFDGKFRGVQLHKFIQATFNVRGHGRVNMLGFVGKFSSEFEGKFLSILSRMTIEGINTATFDGSFSGDRMKIAMKARQKTRVSKNGYVKASEKGTFAVTSKGSTEDGAYSMYFDGDKVFIKIKTKPKKMNGKKRKKPFLFEIKMKMPDLMKMVNGQMDGYWTMYYGGKMLKGSLKQMMP